MSSVRCFFILSPLSRCVLIPIHRLQGEILSQTMLPLDRLLSGSSRLRNRWEAGTKWGDCCARKTNPKSLKAKGSIEHASCYTARSGWATLAPQKVLQPRGTDALGAWEGGASSGCGGAPCVRGAALIDHIGFMGCMIPLVLQNACWWRSGQWVYISQIGSNRVPTSEKKRKSK